MTTANSYSHEYTHNYYREKDCIPKLCEELLEQSTKIVTAEKKTLTPLTPEEQANHDNSKLCHICNGKFTTDETSEHYNNYKKIIDHDHYTGNYRGAAHSICNLRYETQREIPVVIHNGSNYDFHINN